jgi:hypothetical protein
MKLNVAFCLILAILNTAYAETPAKRDYAFLTTWPKQPRDDASVNSDAQISTDRPSFTDASNTVPRGTRQIELGYTYSRIKSLSSKLNSHSYPEIALRQGIFTDWLEVRVSQNLNSTNYAGKTETDFDNLELGTRFAITPQFGFLPELSVTPHLQLPTGSGELRAHHNLPGVSISYSWDISDYFSIAGSTQVYQAEELISNSRYYEWLPSMVMTWSITQEVAIWCEVAGFLPTKAAKQSDSYFTDFGILYVLGKNVQVDFRIGGELGGGLDQNIFTGVGLSIRYYST